MASLLKQVQSGILPAPPRTMLYGGHGVGKSTWASRSESPVFIQTEDGLGEIECAKFPLATEYAQVIQALSELYSEEHDYQTVIVDTLDWLERLIWAEVCRKRGVESIEDIGYGKGYRYDHDEEDSFSGQEYLPDGVRRRRFYEPGRFGFEKDVKRRIDYWERLRRRRRSSVARNEAKATPGERDEG